MKELSSGVGDLSFSATVPERGFEVSLDVSSGEVVAILGANGAGKSTLLSLIAGLLRPESGRIEVDGRVLADGRSGAWVPPHRRGVVLLAQDALLFPHMSAVANVAFGPRSKGMRARDARVHALSWLDAVDAAELADRKTAQLSGGQAQRVALARALAADPAVLLLDEPMAALDVAVAPSMRQLLRKVLRDSKRTTLLVTHDILDALALADRVIVLESGRVVEDGPTREVLSRPRSAFAARIAGVNLLSGVADSHGLTASGLRIHGLLDGGCGAGMSSVAMFRPNAVAVHVVPPAGSPRNQWAMTITELEPRGDVIRVRAVAVADEVTTLDADVTAAAVADLELLPGAAVHFAVKATEVTIYAASAPSQMPGS